MSYLYLSAFFNLDWSYFKFWNIFFVIISIDMNVDLGNYFQLFYKMHK